MRHKVAKHQPRVTDGVKHKVTVTKVEPIVSRRERFSAAQNENVARRGRVGVLAR